MGLSGERGTTTTQHHREQHRLFDLSGPLLTLVVQITQPITGRRGRADGPTIPSKSVPSRFDLCVVLCFYMESWQG